MAGVNKILHLDKNRFEELFREHFKSMTAFAKKYLNDTDLAKEIVHEAFIKLWEKREEIDLNKSVKSYLYTTIYNRSLNYIRDHKKFNQSEQKEHYFDSATGWDQTNDMVASEIQIKIDKTLNDLPDKCKQIFEMSRYEGLKYREIAKELKISVKTVETQMSKALKTLRENLVEFLSILLLFLLK